MEWKKKNTETSSALKHLVEQVDEQSELCDFTVKVGQWEKKFHRCVLAACPYFEKIIMGNFVEKKTGMVEIKHETTSNCVDMALMFLYGRRPGITTDNVEGLLELAEYFMIEDLKSTCIKWFRSVDVTENNCMWLMKLSSKYNFEVKACIKYIESHLHEVFQNEEAVNLSIDSVEYFFSDRRFSYVTNDKKLTFLIKWVNKNTDEESKNVINLFKTIDIQEVSHSALENAKSSAKFGKITNLDQAISMPENDRNRHNVLLVFDEYELSWGLDLHRDRWYRLNSKILDEYTHRYSLVGGHVRGSLPEIYFTEYYLMEQHQWHIGIRSVNLENDQSTTYKFQLTAEETTDGDILRDKPTNIKLADDIVLSTFNIIVPFIQRSEYDQKATSSLARGLATYLPNSLVNGRHEEIFVVPEPENEESSSVSSSIITQNEEILSSTFTMPPLLSTSSRNELQTEELPLKFDMIRQQTPSYSLPEQLIDELATSSRLTDQQTETLDYITEQGNVFSSTPFTTNQLQEEIPSTSRVTNEQTNALQSLFIGIVPSAFYSIKQQTIRLDRHSEVYVGHVSDETAEMFPLFTLRNEHIAQACMNNHSTIGLLTKSLKHVMIFDLSNFKMEKIALKTIEDEKYTMVSTELGFNIYNRKRCYSITRTASGKSQLTEVVFETQEKCNVRYHYFNGMLIRLEYDTDVKLDYISDDTLSSCKSTNDINWKPLSLPGRRGITYCLLASDELCVVPLSKSKLRCDIKCPHCKPRHVADFLYYYHLPLQDSSDDESISGSSNNGDSD